MILKKFHSIEVAGGLDRDTPEKILKVQTIFIKKPEKLNPIFHNK